MVLGPLLVGGSPTLASAPRGYLPRTVSSKIDFARRDSHGCYGMVPSPFRRRIRFPDLAPRMASRIICCKIDSSQFVWVFLFLGNNNHNNHSMCNKTSSCRQPWYMTEMRILSLWLRRQCHRLMLVNPSWSSCQRQVQSLLVVVGQSSASPSPSFGCICPLYSTLVALRNRLNCLIISTDSRSCLIE